MHTGRKNTVCQFFIVPALVLFMVFSISSPVSATNLYETHGHNFQYEEENFFPVVWDLRGAWFYLNWYAQNYITGSSEDYADGIISGVLTEALNSGVNAVLIRDEASKDAEYESNYFPPRADMVRSIGLHIITGGFKDILDEHEHNMEVRNIISDYYFGMQSPPGWGDLIAVHGFDEPDGRYDQLDYGSLERATIISRLSGHRLWCNNMLSLPCGSFMAKPAKEVPSLENPHVNQTGYFSTTYQLCSNIDFPVLDWYPCMTHDESSEVILDRSDIWGVTDLCPTPASNNYYHVYNTRDELWGITYDEVSGSTTFNIYEVTGEGQMGAIGFQPVWTPEPIQPEISWPFDVASSDYRASDVGNRDLDEHNLNGAVVLYHQGDPVADAEVVYCNNDNIQISGLSSTYGTESTILFCVGEHDYRASGLSEPVCTGIIGRAEMRILWCGEVQDSGGHLERTVRIYGRASGAGFIEVTSSPIVLPSGFIPAGAVWGYFWPDSWPHNRSGFVLYDDAGSYVVVYTVDGDNWQPTREENRLFADNETPGDVIAYRLTQWLPFSQSNDLLCSIHNNGLTPTRASWFQWRAGYGDSWLMGYDFNEVSFVRSNYNKIGFRHIWHSNKTRFLFGMEGTSLRASTFIDFPDAWEDSTEIQTNQWNNWGVIAPIRVRHTRKALVNALIQKQYEEPPETDRISIRGGEIVPAYESPPSTEYFWNLCTEGTGTSPICGAFDLEFEYGVVQTPVDNCLFANIQSYGRCAQTSATFCPSHDTGGVDTLLYMTVAPIVHGCRGISFYALDMALLCGPASASTSMLYRAPNELLSWGPSRDSEENVDMISDIHDVTKMLTGGNGGPDFLGALMDDVSYTILDESHAVNAELIGIYSFQAVSPQDNLNFIALEDNASQDILVIVSNDVPYNPDSQGAEWIWFPTYNACYYDAPECWGGYGDVDCDGLLQFISVSEENDRRTSPVQDAMTMVSLRAAEGCETDARKDILPLVLYYGDMDPFSVSLIRIPCNLRMDEENSSSVLPEMQIARNENGEVIITINPSGYPTEYSLSLYDISGRKVSALRAGHSSGEMETFVLESDQFRPGLYFAVLFSNSEIIESQKVFLF